MTAIVITPPKSFDAYTAGRARAELREAVSTHSAVIVDLEAVEFMDMHGLGTLAGALRVARAHDCRMTVVCTREPILKMFRITEMNRVLDVRSSIADAEES